MTDIAADGWAGPTSVNKRRLSLLLLLGLWSFIGIGDFSPRIERPDEPKCPTAVWGESHWGEACFADDVSVPGRIGK
jgi:hypothetical protein